MFFYPGARWQDRRGGTMDGGWAGVNWWSDRRLKASVGYGNIDLDRFGVEGNTKTLLTRVQWIYRGIASRDGMRHVQRVTQRGAA